MTDITLVPEPEESLPGLSVSTNQGILQWISSVDHKQIGIMYLWLSVLFLLVAGIEILFSASSSLSQTTISVLELDVHLGGIPGHPGANRAEIAAGNPWFIFSVIPLSLS